MNDVVVGVLLTRLLAGTVRSKTAPEKQVERPRYSRVTVHNTHKHTVEKDVGRTRTRARPQHRLILIAPSRDLCRIRFTQHFLLVENTRLFRHAATPLHLAPSDALLGLTSAVHNTLGLSHLLYYKPLHVISH